MLRSEIVVDTVEEFEKAIEKMDLLKPLFTHIDIYCMFDHTTHFYVLDNVNDRYVEV